MFDEKQYFQVRKNEVLEMYKRFENQNIELNLDNKIILDLGGGGGIHAGLIASRNCHVFSVDSIDMFAKYGDNFIDDLQNRFIRNQEYFPSDKIKFTTGNALSLQYSNNFFDYIFSFNSLEHISDPLECLKECHRVLNKAGMIYATFSPIWTSATGNHFSDLCPEPWGHLVDSISFCEKLKKAGASDEVINDYNKAMNRKPYKYYKDLLDHIDEYGYKIVALHYWQGGGENIEHENFDILIRSGYSEEDLLTNGAYFILEKK